MKYIYSLIIIPVIIILLAIACKKQPQSQCVITSPDNGASFVVGDTITVSAEITLYDFALWDVVLYVNGNEAGYDFEPPFTFTVPTNDYLSGEYTLTVQAESMDDEPGVSDNVTITISALKPQADFYYEKDHPMYPRSVYFVDQSTNVPSSWLWDFGDGTTSTEQNPRHTYPTAGSFTVSLTVTNEAGSSTLVEPYLIKLWNNCPEAPTVLDIMHHEYQTVKIGEQCWMRENLRTPQYPNGEWITFVDNSLEWAALSPYDPAACTNDLVSAWDYGILYNYCAATANNWQNDNEEGQGICPDGWRLPTKNDFEVLANYLISNGYNWDRTINENKVAKSIAMDEDWRLNDMAGTPGNNQSLNNSSGFGLLPAGIRTIQGDFIGLYSFSALWTASLANAEQVQTVKTEFSEQMTLNSENHIGEGLPVRCIKQ
ncbi:MAG: hypothetical protein C0593_00025 [Marinilabiliales bacterium]|nr:MAG: hypothetical protein C0593_00025 [Marinilabiliales bacterium]